MNLFCFTLPIGWDELGVIATVAAVVVALRANCKATTQLKSALKMQEQSKNVELMDKRLAIAEEIQREKRVPELTLKVLFDNEIFEQYQKWIGILNAAYEAHTDLTLNQIDVSPEEAKAHAEQMDQNAIEEKSQLLDLIELFISKSIQPV